ncbi:MAG: tetratricopeptide repeat protein [Bacteroidota bacterium]
MKRLIIGIFLSLFFLSTSQGRNVNLDSLQQILPTVEGQEKIKVLVRLAYMLHKKETDKAEVYVRESLELCYQTNDLYFMALSYDLLGRISHRQDKKLIAADCFEKGIEAITQVENQPLLTAVLYHSYGLLLSSKEEYNKALPNYLKAKSIHENIKAYKQLGQLLANLGTLYLRIKEYDKAIETLRQLIDLEEDMGPGGYKLIVQGWNVLGTVYEKLNLYDRALECYNEALEMVPKTPSRIAQMGTLTSLFSIYVKKHQPKQARDYYEQAFSIASEEENTYWLQRLHSIYGNFMMEKGNHQEALAQFQKSMEYAKILDKKKLLMELHNDFAEVYEHLEQYQTAYQHHKISQELQDSLFSEIKTIQLAEIQAKYDLQKMEEEISNLRREEEFSRVQRYGLLIILSCFLAALAALYSRYRIRHRSLFLLEEQHRQIEHKNLQLEQQSLDIQEKNRKLGEINQELGQFAYAASHDLKQPLRTISSYLDLLKKRYQPELDKDAKDFIQYASIGAKRMEKILKDLLNYSQVGRSQMHKEAVDLNQVMEQIQYQLALQIAETHTKIQYDDLPTVQARPTEMVQLFQNLISNSIKFRAPGRKPYLFIGAEKTPDEFLISIADNGIGISEDFEKNVFEMFERQYSQDQFEGSGIGLALCKKIMDYNEGRIWFKTIDGKGTTFFLAFPIHSETHA